jgi:hypothetical protein
VRQPCVDRRAATQLVHHLPTVTRRRGPAGAGTPVTNAERGPLVQGFRRQRHWRLSELGDRLQRGDSGGIWICVSETSEGSDRTWRNPCREVTKLSRIRSSRPCIARIARRPHRRAPSFPRRIVYPATIQSRRCEGRPSRVPNVRAVAPPWNCMQRHVSQPACKGLQRQRARGRHLWVAAPGLWSTGADVGRQR